ncbi:hypothetical protein J3R30DRAFT_3735428 [Lentinula aciculospora]|uniref:Uncharacterized protein n=1 Tax=Lentinula aciculospora TaxID=153920 RepID=A0A9W9DL41_9AGAR|nr:hypothetical protein J3R30DRAFT_3735428 [Lentinula aciculospora]
MLLPKVFSNTMLANMNSRATLQNMQSSVEMSGRSMSSTNHRGIALQVTSQPKTINISVHTEVGAQQDLESRQWPLALNLEMGSEVHKSDYAPY